MNEAALGELARITARVSAASFATALFGFAARRRLSRRVPVRLFGAFLAAHAIHFTIVFLLGYATGGENFQARGGYPLTIAVGALFTAAAIAGFLRVRAFQPAPWMRLAGGVGIGFIWFAFTASIVGRIVAFPIYAVETAVLAAAFLAFLNESRRNDR
jgi:hypothetical protein